MKNKIGIFLACMVLIISIVPVSALTNVPNNTTITYQDSNWDYRSKVKHLDDGREPPNPGDVSPDFVFETHELVQIISNPPEKTLQSIEEIIIEILENLDEDLILGYLEDLVAFGPRATGTNACHQAGDYIYDEFESYGLEARYDDWSYGGYSGNNIEGTLPGIDGTSDEIYIICAHYDSVPGSPGADDDGSGTAAVLAAANLMSQYDFNHTIRFVAFDGEEQGLLGSHEYVEEAYGNGDNIEAVLNGDMIGYATNPTEASMIKIYENSASSWITDFTEEVSQNYEEYFGLTVVPSGSSYGSDHASFWQFNYHAIFYHEYKFNDYYHSPQDIIENMDVDYCTRVTRLMTATLGELAEAQKMSEPPETPSKPEGPETWTINEEATFTSSTTDPEGEDIYYLFDWGDGDDSGWIGPYGSGQAGKASHIWTELGEYQVKVMAKDDYDYQSDWSDPATITIVENQPPNRPIITGPKTGKPMSLLTFKVTAKDPDGNNISYMVSWGDGHYEPYTELKPSGTEVIFSHAWRTPGIYTICVKAKDQYGAKSPQASLKLTIAKNRAVTNPVLFQLLEKIIDHFPVLRYLFDR